MLGSRFLAFFVLFASPFVLASLPLFLWRMLGNERKRPAQPVCARCRYPTRYLSAPRCPECGADLLRDGVITPSMRVREGGGVLLAAAAWTIIVGVGAMFLAWSAHGVPFATEVNVSVRGAPVSGQYQNFAVRGTAELSGNSFAAGFGSSGPSDFILVVHANDGVAHTRTFTRALGEANFRLDDGRATDEFNFPGLTAFDVVEELLVAAGADPTNAVTKTEAREISNSIIGGIGLWSISTAGTFGSVSNSTNISPKSTVMARLIALVPFGVMLVGVAAWIAGLVILLKQNAKRFRPRSPQNRPAIPADQPEPSA